MEIDFSSGLLGNTVTSLLVIGFLIVFLSLVGWRVGKLGVEDKPKGIVFLMVTVVDIINTFIKEFYGKRWRTFAPLLTAIFLYLAFANTAGLLGLTPPLASLTIAFSMSLTVFLTIQVSALIIRKPWRRVKDLAAPNPLLLPINLVGEISTPLAMGLRLFGNLLSGAVLASVFYAFLPPVASVFITAGLLHPVFSIGFGLIQAMVFFLLFTIFLSLAIEDTDVA